MQFEKLYINTPDSLKLKFLNGIISNNISLQNDFINFTQSEQKVAEVFPMTSFTELLSSTKKRYQADFEMVDTDNPD